MEKNIIIVQTVFDNLEDVRQSIDSVRHAAHRWGVDFHEMSYIKHDQSIQKFFWDRNWAIKNFSNYDKVLLLDPDVVINSKSPNIFNEIGEYDLAVVRDGNPEGRFENKDYFRNNIVTNIAHLDNCVNIFENNIKDFQYESYWNGYFNNGVFLYRPKKIVELVIRLEELIFNNRFIYEYLASSHFSTQNLYNALISSNQIKVKFLADKWNWIAPDLAGKNGFFHDQFISETSEIFHWERDYETPPDWTHDIYRGPMHPNIYHFCGTGNSKELLKNYQNWK